MGLPPLEYSDCFLDSPSFREIISLYEQELELNTRVVKNLVKECNNMIQKTEEFSRVQQEFARGLSQFRFQTIGTEKTEDEVLIANSLQSFARLFLSIEDYRQNMLMAIKVRLLKTLENFRKEHMKKAIEEKRKFDDASKKYYTFLNSYLTTKAPKKRDTTAVVSNTEKDQFEREKAQFRQISFDYVCRLQDVHAQKHYEFVEPIIGYVSDMTTFLHQAYEEALNLKPQIDGIQFKVQLLRETHESEQEKAYQLKAQVIEDGLQGMVHHPEFLKQGHVMVMERRGGISGIHWQRFFCQFRKKEQQKMIKFLALSSSAPKNPGVPLDDWIEINDCVRSKGDEVDRRFCFDLSCNLKEPQYKPTCMVQAIGEDDRRAWMQVMEGREPVYYSMRALDMTKITPAGHKFIETCLNAIEDRGLDEEGLYRKPGVLAKVNKLVKEAIEKNAVNALDFSDEIEWDTKTLASAVKAYFGRQLGEPMMTFLLHASFIEAAKISDVDKRVEAVKELINQLPFQNKDLLVILIVHLRNVSDMCDKNLMKPSNLAVCFGPTLMRPEHETVASIVDIRYQNIIVETMIKHVDEIFPGSRYLPRNRHNVDSKSSELLPGSIKRRTPPAAPTKRVSAVDFVAKKSHDTRSQTLTNDSNFPVTPLVSNKDIPPPPVTHRPSTNRYVTTPTSRSVRPPPVVTARLESKESKKSDHLELHQPQKPGITSQKPDSGKLDHLELQRTQKTGKATQKPGNISTTHTPPYQTGRITRTESTPPIPPSQESKPLSRRSPPGPPVKTSDSTTHPPGRQGKALYECDAEDEFELSFQENETLYNVIDSDEPDWLLATNSSGQRGLVPANYIQLL